MKMDTNEESLNQEASNKRKVRPEDGGEEQSDEKTPKRINVHEDEAASLVKDDPEEERRKLEEKRAYNRRNAARARQRTKEHILDLTARAERFAAKNNELQRANDTLVAEVKLLRDENQRLRQLVGAAGVSGAGPAAPGNLHPQLQGAGHTIMDQTGLHAPAPTATIIFPPQGGDSGANAQGQADNNALAAAARQRGLLLQLLQGQQAAQDPRQSLPPGYPKY
jgi:hypothetical protein